MRDRADLGVDDLVGHARLLNLSERQQRTVGDGHDPSPSSRGDSGRISRTSVEASGAALGDATVRKNAHLGRAHRQKAMDVAVGDTASLG